jgi:ankyrin repeat protein
LLIEKGASIHVQDNHKKTILLDAVSHSNLNIVKLLLEKEADVNKADDEGNTPLLEAVSNSNLNIVKLLLEKGADVNKANDEGKTPLTAAALEAYDLNILKLLLEKGADVNHPANYKNFWIAIEQGEFAAAQALLNAGSDLVLHIEKKGLSGLNVFRNKFNKFFNNEFDGLNAAGKLELLRVFNFMQGNYELFSKLYTKEEILDKKTSIEATQPLKELIDSSIHDIKNTYDADKKTEKLVKFKGLLSKYKDLVDNVSADSMEMKEFITQALELNIDLWQTIKAYMPQDNLKRKAPEPAENGKTELIDLPSKLQKVDLNDAVNEDSLDYENNHFDDFDSNMHNIEELGSMFDPM